MSDYKILVDDDNVRRELNAQLDECTRLRIVSSRNFEFELVEDFARVARVSVAKATNKGVSNLDDLFPCLRRHDGRVPRWVPTFHLNPSAASVGHRANAAAAATSAEALIEKIEQWAKMLEDKRLRDRSELHRETLEKKYSESIRTLRMPDGAKADNGEELAFIPGGTRYWEEVRQQVQEAAESAKPVLLQGATGCGKEIFARLIASLYFAADSFKKGKFVASNAATLSLELKELFGIAAGRATGVREQTGLFGDTQDGVLFLDEIATLQMQLQAQLLRVMSSGDFDGVKTGQRWSGKLIVATNEPIDKDEKVFRKDLFQRLSPHHIRLRGHGELAPEDQATLIRGVLLCALRQIERSWGVPEGRCLLNITEGGLSKLLGWNFDGSIRQMKHVIHQAAERSIYTGFVIGMECLPAEPGGMPFDLGTLRSFTDGSILMQQIFSASEKYRVEPSRVMQRMLIDHLTTTNHEAASSNVKLGKKIGIDKSVVSQLKKDEKVRQAAAQVHSNTTGTGKYSGSFERSFSKLDLLKAEPQSKAV